MKSNTTELIIPIGLPGSGKTYYGKYLDETRKQVILYNLDDYINAGKSESKDEIAWFRYRLCDPVVPKERIVYADGPWFTEKTLYHVLEVILNMQVKSHGPKIDMITFVYWNENREQCIINDTGRRNVSSVEDIKHIPYIKLTGDVKSHLTDIIRANNFYNDTKIVFEYKDVYSTDKIDRYVADKFEYNRSINNHMFYSEAWTTGGEWGDCWGNSGETSPEEPLEFKEFDKLLMEVCPDITFLKYKDVFNAACDKEEYSEYGYYGTYTHYARWTCNVDILKQKLAEYGYDYNN